MPDPALEEHLAYERSLAARSLLANPLIDSEDDPDTFRLVVRHASWLSDYFETACGWSLSVDPASGFGRLAKRSSTPDVTRPLRRTRGQSPPFDRRRYELLCQICAELVRHPVTTIGLLASAVSSAANLETGRYGERSAFVDALLVLRSWGAVRATGGDMEAFLDSERANAILTADTARLHRLIVSTTAPSTLPAGIEAVEAVERLVVEPRYGSASDSDSGDTSDEARNRWARHQLARRLLDDPLVYFDDLSPTEADYASSPSGRRWLRQRVGEAGLEIEERTEGLMAVDPDALATDIRFPAPLGNVHQLALLLADQLIETTASGQRRLGHLDPDQLGIEIKRIFDRFPGWARGQRVEGGPERLGQEAVDLLVSFRLARREPDGGVSALPGLARYRMAEPVVTAGPTLFDE